MSGQARCARNPSRPRPERTDGERHSLADQVSGLVSDLLDLRVGSLQQLRPEVDQCPRRRDLLTDQRLIRVARISVRVTTRGYPADDGHARVDRATGVAEKFAVKVDVTEEFPFLVGALGAYYDR